MNEENNDEIDLIASSPPSVEVIEDIDLQMPDDYYFTSFYEVIRDILYKQSFWNSLRRKLLEYEEAIKDGDARDVLRFEVPVIFSDIVCTCQKLAKLMFFDFEAATSLFEDVIFDYIKNWELFEHGCIVRDQVYAVLRIEGGDIQLPFLSGPSNFNTANANQLIFYQGIITTEFNASQYLQSTCYECENLACKEQNGPYLKRVHYAQNESTDISKLCLLCCFCKSQLKENKGRRVFGEEKMIMVSQFQSLLDRSHVVQSIFVCCRDELIAKIKKGVKYIFTGLVVYSLKNQRYSAVIEANNLSPCMNLNWRATRLSNDSGLKKTVQRFKSDGAVWQLPFFLAHHFGTAVIPEGVYFGLKLVLLLTMMQDNADRKNIFSTSVLVLSPDTSVVSRLFNYTASFCPFFINQPFGQQEASDVHLSLMYDFRSVKGTLWARNYAYVMNDLRSSPAEDCVALISEVQGAKKILVNCDEDDEDLKKTVLSTATNIWASLKWSSKRNKFYQGCSGMEYLSFKDKKLNKVVHSFDLIYRLDAWDTEKEQNAIARHTLFQACGRYVEKNHISSEEWMEFFDHAREQCVQLTDDVKDFVNKYYVKRRLFSEKQGSLTYFPKTIVQTLLTLSEAFAKLSLVDSVQVCHAVVAVILVEENLLVRTGSTPFEILLRSDLPVKVTFLFYDEQGDCIMERFQKSIHSFVSDN